MNKKTWEKGGPSPNPGGQPKGKRISTWMVELGQMDKLPDPATLPINGQIALARLKQAITARGVRDSEFVASLTEPRTNEKPEEKPGTFLPSDRKLDEYESPRANA